MWRHFLDKFYLTHLGIVLKNVMHAEHRNDKRGFHWRYNQLF